MLLRLNKNVRRFCGLSSMPSSIEGGKSCNDDVSGRRAGRGGTAGDECGGVEFMVGSQYQSHPKGTWRLSVTWTPGESKPLMTRHPRHRAARKSSSESLNNLRSGLHKRRSMQLAMVAVAQAKTGQHDLQFS